MVTRDLKRHETTHGVAHDHRFCKAQVIEQTDDARDVFGEHVVGGGDRF